MLVFDYVLILLAAVFLSNVVNRLVPTLSLPIVQIILGALIEIIPHGMFGFGFELEPELFFVLFLSPLVFNSTMQSDKKTMRIMLKPILMAAVGLVFLTIFVVGGVTHLLIPSIPLAAAFALAAALGATDVVAVEAVSHRISLPKKIMGILSGESIINDATGIVFFQFAILAASTGSFILLHGVARFLILAIGGMFTGLIITVLKYLLVKWLHSLDIHKTSLHISIGIITPFIIFMIAEDIGVSGIFAVFFSGMAHSIFHDKFNPEVAKLNNAENNVWSVMSFSLDGLVFVILGVSLPRILEIYISGAYDKMNVWEIVGCVLLIALALMTTRFAWWVTMVRHKIYDTPEEPIGKIKSGIIFSVAGARGAVSLATIMSIPLLLPNGSAFPERDLIILIASGVIVISLLMTNFVLPLLAKQKTEITHNDIERAVLIEILQTVTDRLKAVAMPENYAATEIVIRNYYTRMSYRVNNNRSKKRKNYKSTLRQEILHWEKDFFLRMAEMEQININETEQYLEKTDSLMNENGKKTNIYILIARVTWLLIQSFFWKEPKRQGKVNEQVTLSHLGQDSAYDNHQAIIDVAVNGLNMERILIQQQSEAGRLSWKTAKHMQANIALLEAQLQDM